MINVCYGCGEYRADKIIDPEGPFAICPLCGYKHSFKMQPLLVVSGASGAGKSAVTQRLLGQVPGAVLLESDILWMEAFDKPEEGYRQFFESWLRVAMNISQSSDPVVLFGAGLGIPGNLESCVERRYFSIIHYLGLVCADEELDRRLSLRPLWRGCNKEEFILKNKEFNHWFTQVGCKGEPQVDLLDTTGASLDVVAEQVKRWIMNHL